jgi:hypothetical protein
MRVRFSVGGVVALGCRTWFRGAPRFLAIAMVLYLPYVAWIVAQPIPGLDDVFYRFYRYLMEQHMVVRSLASGSYVLGALTTAAIAHGAIAALDGRPVPIGEALRTALYRFVPVVVLAVLSLLLSSLVGPALFSLALAARLEPSLFWMWMAIHSVFQAIFYLAIPVAVVERRGIIGSIRRSLSLIRGALLRVYALLVLLHIVSWGCVQIISYALAPDPRNNHEASYATAFLVYGWVSLAFRVVWASISIVINTVAYRTLRDAKEGPPADELASVFE